MRMIGFDESEITAVMKAIFTDKKIWNEEDRGVKTREEMSDFLVSFAPELEDLIRRFYADATISVTPMEYSRKWITDLKNAGLHVYILSNFGEYAWNRAVELGAINFMDLVDGAVRSYEIHHVKPEPEIYQTVLSRYGLSAAECVFIDDVEANVQAARENGMEAIVFKGYEDAVCRLEEIGVI